MVYVYILRSSKNGSYYIGCTNSVEKRIIQHNSDRVRSTRAGKPWILLHTEEYSTLAMARRRETQIKRWKSRAAIERLIKKS
ncbi:MAG: hypothetical protein A2544_01235 [Candidatus Zambryskibacteria bacterium RIFOXYD2_FULL_43_10]|uniref:GIY-YIG domain-containing protein n=1 Tax=Candidatus Zambryskibacteria bacterium RIFOXYD2_FULL_43_10 TaxID=1802782 RepID=A0A1G2V5T1_9BACT|nr:MAG: hypothetical protein A2544_01235 [Candidatus Zambryskibacteria bacterium RIFOXYD2_FULL_43_10]